MRIGILGYGQLGRMLAMAGIPLGFSFSFYDDLTNSLYRTLVASEGPAMTGPQAFDRFLEEVDLVTYETENTSLVLVDKVRFLKPLLPGKKVLELTQNRILEKTMCHSLGIPTTEFKAIYSLADCFEAADILQYPFVLKTNRMGYDGLGQKIIGSPEEIEPAWQALNSDSLIAESWVQFDHECSLIAVSDQTGNKRFYPLVRNTHQAGMLRYSMVDPGHPYTAEAQKIAETVLDHFKYVGILAIEFFVTEQGLYVNELAPRVHNSGHWSIEGALTSQFANHIRAMTNLPIGDTSLRVPFVAMVNLIGNLDNIEQILRIPGASVHLYGKAARPNRKLGHVTLLASDPKTLEKQLKLTGTLCGAMG